MIPYLRGLRVAIALSALVAGSPHVQAQQVTLRLHQFLPAQAAIPPDLLKLLQEGGSPHHQRNASSGKQGLSKMIISALAVCSALALASGVMRWK